MCVNMCVCEYVCAHVCVCVCVCACVCVNACTCACVCLCIFLHVNKLIKVQHLHTCTLSIMFPEANLQYLCGICLEEYTSNSETLYMYPPG